jgi:hypothetical protein
MPIRIRRNICLTWLDPEGGKRLARALQRRLQTKLDLDTRKSKRSRFITLTYDRTPYGEHGQFTLWQQAHRGDGHIRQFIRRLERHTGRKYTGQWIAKKEFQDGGWLHWHLIFYDTGNISIEELTAAWGHGHCHIERVDKDASHYIAKYQAKPGEVPGWLYDLPGRSLKLVQSSPGFWAHEKDPDHIPTPRVNYNPREYHPREPIWQRMEIARQTITVREPHNLPRKLYGDYGALLIALRMQGYKWLGEERIYADDGTAYSTGNIEIDCTYRDAQDAINRIANTDAFGNPYRKTFINTWNRTNKPSEAASGWAAAAGRLLDKSHKNPVTEPHEDLSYDGDPILEDTYETQADFYGWAQLASIDPQYAMQQAFVHEQITDIDTTLDGEHLPF